MIDEDRKAVSALARRITGKPLITAKKLFSSAYEYKPDEPEVYFLINNGEVVYIGQSICLRQRLRDHFKYRVKFDSYYSISCKKEDLNELESIYIYLFNPSKNGRSSNGRPFAPKYFRDLVKKGLRR